MKKQISIIILLILNTFENYSQVGIATTNPKATLDIAGSPNLPTVLDGVIAPRITGNQLKAKTYTTEQTGAIVYVTSAADSPTGQYKNVTEAGYYYFDGSYWVIFSGAKDFWKTTGNLGTSATTNYIGTNDAVDFIIKTNLTERVTVKSDGKVGIASTTPQALFQVGGSETATQVSSFGIKSSTASSTSDYDTSSFKDFNGGIIQYKYINPLAGSASLHIIATGQESAPAISSNIIFHTKSAVANVSVKERMRIDKDGRVGIGTTSPRSLLDLKGSLSLSHISSPSALEGEENTVFLLGGGTSFTYTNATFGYPNGRIYIIRNTSTSLDVTVYNIIDFNSTLAANFALTPAIGSITIFCDGVNWYRIQ